MSNMLSEEEKMFDLLAKNADLMCPDLEYSLDQVKNDKKAKEYVKTWRDGPYSVKSLQMFAAARCSYLYSESKLGANQMDGMRRLLRYLYWNDDSFSEEIEKIRSRLGLASSAQNVEFENFDEAIDSMERQYEEKNHREADENYKRRIAEEVIHLQEKFKLSGEWYDILLCQIASPDTIQLTVVKNMVRSQKFIISEAYGGAITIKFLPGITKPEMDILWKVLKPLTGTQTKNGYVDIWDAIKADRESGLSWSRLARKYEISKDAIRQKLRYDEKH